MSKIKFAELQEVKSELSLLTRPQTSGVVGGRRNININPQINAAQIIQVQNVINVNLNFGGGDNTSVVNLVANAGINQGNQS